jgi:hypothetical protein
MEVCIGLISVFIALWVFSLIIAPRKTIKSLKEIWRSLKRRLAALPTWAWFLIVFVALAGALLIGFLLLVISTI